MDHQLTEQVVVVVQMEQELEMVQIHLVVEELDQEFQELPV